MSEEATLHGCIGGMHGTADRWYGLYPLNKAVIDALPEEDDYPPLVRSLFTVPMDYGRPGTAFYRSQMIHFGASFNWPRMALRSARPIESVRIRDCVFTWPRPWSEAAERLLGV